MKSMKLKSEAATAREHEERRAYISDQKEIIKVMLARVYMQEEMQEIDKQLDSNKITMKWYGQTFPIAILKMERAIKHNTYKDLVMQEEELKRKLVAAGLTIVDIKKIYVTQTIFSIKPTGLKK